MKTNFAVLLAAALALASPLPAAAMPSGGAQDETGASASPAFKGAVAAIKAERWAEAQKLLKRVIADYPESADAHNYLGFATRKSGDKNGAMPHYLKALSLDPSHRGAHEYIGELFLEMGDLKSAEQHLTRLAELCPTGCEERDDLAEAVAKYKTARK
jgi:tetratricopeptide (TPR) repeat protein